MAEKTTVGIVISFAVAILVGVVLIAIIADQTNVKTTLTTVTETVNIAPARIGSGINATYPFHLTHGCPAATSWRTDAGNCDLVNGGVTNSTGGVLADPTDYVFTTNGGVCSGLVSGDVTFVNSTALIALITSNSTSVTYSYCPDDYVTTSWARTVMNMVPGFFALAILIGAAFLIYIIMKKEGFEI